MGVNIGTYDFEGPYYAKGYLEDRSGVYAILCKINDKYKILDIGESSAVRTRVENHDREDCWESHCGGTIMYAVYYTPNKQQAGRMEIEQELRKQFNPPCGDR